MALISSVVLAAVRVIGRQMRTPQCCLQNVIAGDDLILRKAPPAVHSSDARILAGEILLQPRKPFFCFHLFCLCFCAFLRNLLSLRYFCSRRHGFQGVGAFMFYVVFVTRLPGCSISGVSRVNSCSVSAGFQVFLKQSFHFLRIGGIDDADTGIVDVDVLMPHAIDLPRFMYYDP